MKQAVEFANIDIYYQDFGKGTPVVLLHGYLESGEIWEAFAKELSKQYRIILIDLPGHGDSGSAGEIHSMDFMADSVARVLDRLHLETCFMIGHSMGGYVALAFLETYPYKLGGLVLFHSHPLADSMETKANREREIKLVRDGRKDLIFNTNIPKAFAVGNLNKFRKEVRC